MDQWLALLILGDLDPYTPPITPRVSLPTRSTKSPLSQQESKYKRWGCMLSLTSYTASDDSRGMSSRM